TTVVSLLLTFLFLPIGVAVAQVPAGPIPAPAGVTISHGVPVSPLVQDKNVNALPAVSTAPALHRDRLRAERSGPTDANGNPIKSALPGAATAVQSLASPTAPAPAPGTGGDPFAGSFGGLDCQWLGRGFA